jgi:hypothetical protein
MQARFPGTCRDCGNKFPAGTDIHYDRRTKKASCCNGTPKGTMFPATQEQAQEWQEYFGKDGDSLASNPSQRPMVVDGAQRMEWVDGKTTQEIVDVQGDSYIYQEKEYNGYNWMCLECRLVWERQHQAVSCKGRGHVASFEQSYGGILWDGRGFTPPGLVAGKYLPNTGTTYVRMAIRREKSTDTPPVAPAPVPVEYLPYGGVTDGKDSEWVPVNYPQADPQDMTSEEMWESMSSVTQPTITTTWN